MFVEIRAGSYSICDATNYTVAFTPRLMDGGVTELGNEWCDLVFLWTLNALRQ